MLVLVLRLGLEIAGMLEEDGAGGCAG